MKNAREEWFDPAGKVSVTVADATDAAQALASGHLAGPASAYFLAKALAACAALSAELSEEGETFSLQMKCDGPLGGFNVECTREGALRGYTDKKILDGFDGMGEPDAAKAIGAMRIQATRSVPGRILSQGISSSLDGYLAGSLQRKALVFADASVTDDVRVLMARAVLVEALPDSDRPVSEIAAPLMSGRGGRAGRSLLASSSRNILAKLGLPRAELKKTTPLAFGCRCSAERARAMVEATAEKGEALPPAIDVTCHMCGRVYTVDTAGIGGN